ncbi:glycoside hydrolase [Solibacillus sp. R5-41]|uniref:glycosyl hydrolase family 18 protein n=1 Tax=Solibacillus sp. R5-41 TaxID=2048654 RepID=UPI000C127A80|nr:glycosyl hydrolase family 18 protein [Solibacillus sp. R5-41]ATP39893.1 glycoside hydrolase [Solibacillus sp. R5-41]
MKKKINKYFLIPILFTTLFAAPLSTVASIDDVHMSYLYGADSNTSLKNIDKTYGAINTVTPGFYELNADGSLKSSIDKSFIDQVHKRGLKVVPFISNHWDRNLAQIAMQNRERLTSQIADSIIKNNLDGIDIDIENLNYTDKDAFTDFIRLLHEKLPNDKIISIAVAANPNNYTTGWHGSYDYVKLSEYSDYLMVMAYDESWNGGPEGPVASLPFVEKSIQSLLNQGVDSKKIVLGLPFYGRIWNDAMTVVGDGVPNKAIAGIVNNHNGKFYFDNAKKSAYAKFTVKSSDSPTTIGGKKLVPGNYTIWYENDLSLKYKLRLVEKYNLRGSGSWDLNQATSGIWKFYSAWANGEHHFIDSENHWAEKDIMSLFNKGWINGKNEYNFDPNGNLTRAQAVTILIKAIGLDAKNEAIPNYFTDVPANHWAKQAIELANKYNIVNGTNPHVFEPNTRITRAQLAAILSRIVDYPTSNTIESPFYDVPKGHWAYSDILKLSSNGIIKGNEVGGFSPDDFVLRAQIAAMVNRASADFKNY